MAEAKGEGAGMLGDRLRGSLSGHHPLFELEDIRAALAKGPEGPLDPAHADEVGKTLVALARDGYSRARLRVETLAPGARDALIRLYFRLLERSREVRGNLH
jgi:hypothetical protein